MENEREFGLDLYRSRLGFVEGLAERIRDGGGGNGATPRSFAFVLGTRRGDPNCGLQSHFTPSR